MDPCVKVEAFVLGGKAQPGGIDIRTVIAQTVLGGELSEGATLHRDRSAPLDGPLLGRLVGACFEWILVDVTVPAEPRRGALTHPTHDALKLGSVGWRGRMKYDVTIISYEDPVEKRDMQM
jgi:hypothetical protein